MGWNSMPSQQIEACPVVFGVWAGGGASSAQGLWIAKTWLANIEPATTQ